MEEQRLTEFGKRLKDHRERQYTRAEFAKKASVSVSFVSLLENGSRRAKRHLVNEMADLLKLSFEERNELLTLAGHEAFNARPEAIEDLGRLLQGLELTERETALLISELKAHAKRWKQHRKAREEDVTTAVIVAAGWQARLVAPYRLESMILPTAQEAVSAGIRRLIVVVADSKAAPRLERLRGSLDVAPIIVVQEEPKGLGDAVRCTKSQVDEVAFALLLPVDVDPERRAAKEMLDCFKTVRKPMVAVNPAQLTVSSEFQHYGLAVLGAPVPGTQGLNYIDRLEEKRRTDDIKESYRMIVGRYVLTPEIFDVLEDIAPNRHTTKIELTDALETFRRNHHHVCAYSLGRGLLPLASVRVMMETLIDSIENPEKLAKAIELSRKVLLEAGPGGGGKQ